MRRYCARQELCGHPSSPPPSPGASALQVPTDEPVSSLLERIASETQLVQRPSQAMVTARPALDRQKVTT